MSRKSKLKKQIKGYVRARQLAGALVEGHRAGVQDGFSSGMREGRKRLEEELTLYVAEPDESFVLGERPKQPFVRVAVMPRHYGRVALDVRDERMLHMSPNLTTVSFRARRQGFVLPDGRNVVWWDWEVCR